MVKQVADRLPLGLALLALGIAIVGVYFAWQANRQARLNDEAITEALEAAGPGTTDEALLAAQITLRDANRAEERADAASTTAGTIMGLIETGSILVGALITGGAVIFGLSISGMRSRLDSTVNDAQEQIRASEERVRVLEKEMREQLAQAVRDDEARLRENQAQFALLNEQLVSSLETTQDRVSHFQEVIDQAVGEARQDAESAFRVLTLLLLAEQQVRARNYETAIATLKDAISIDPDNQPANYLLGYVYVGRKRFMDAIRHLEQALKVNPDFAPALAAMGLAQYKMADAESETLKKNQLRAQAEINLTRALQMDRSLVDADNESYFGSLGGLYRRQGRDQEALDAYKQAVEITPDRSYPVGNLATLYKRFGHEADAQKMYLRSIELAEARLDDHPGDIWARLDLAQAYLITGDRERAMSEYRNVLGRIDSPGPIESAMKTLNYLKTSPEPILHLDEVLEMMQRKLANLPRETQQ